MYRLFGEGMGSRILCFFVFLAAGADIAPGEEVLLYRGAGDASAAVAITEDMFIVADDENNVLRVYRTAETGSGRSLTAALPVCSYDMTGFLGIDSEHPEADIEGATMIGRRIYWITSHGRNKDGKMRPNRYRFFATETKTEGGRVTVSAVGAPCKTLVHSLIRAASVRHLELDKVTRLYAADLKKKEREKLAPKEEGLNIEALCASADGRTLFIGFRNPRPNGRALVVPLRNAAAVVERQQGPDFGEPMLWDFKGLGIRSMEYSHFHRAYFIIAGAYDESRKFALYQWSGRKGEPPALMRELRQGNFSPEALVPFNNSGRLMLLSDDGSMSVKISGPHECVEGEYRKDGTCENKYLLDPNRKTFRCMWLTP
jgi:hypothetical protein